MYAKAIFSPQTMIFPPPLPLLHHHNAPSTSTSLSTRRCTFSQSQKKKINKSTQTNQNQTHTPKNVKDLVGNWQGLELRRVCQPPTPPELTPVFAALRLAPVWSHKLGFGLIYLKPGPDLKFQLRSWLSHSPQFHYGFSFVSYKFY